MSDIIIKLDNVSKSFKTTTVLNNISQEFEKGKIYGLVGRNGSGKTMLLKCICGFVAPTEGKVVVNGKVVGKDVDIPEDIGLIIETPGFLPNYDGFNNLKFLAMINNKISDEDIRNVMKKVGLDNVGKKHVGKYSLGMRQRLGIAQAIMENPSILILDEPMNGLDNSGVEEMRKLFLGLKKEGKTILLASHGKEDISILCDRVLEMDHGNIIDVIEKEGCC